MSNMGYNNNKANKTAAKGKMTTTTMTTTTTNDDDDDDDSYSSRPSTIDHDSENGTRVYNTVVKNVQHELLRRSNLYSEGQQSLIEMVWEIESSSAA